MSGPEMMSNAVTCPHDEVCGSCAFLGREYEAQLEAKRETVVAALGEHSSLEGVELLPCLPSPRVSGYRNRAKLAVGLPPKGVGRGQVRFGYFIAGTREIGEATDCRVLVPELLESTRKLHRFLQARVRSIPKALRHVDIRHGSDPAHQHLTLVLRARELPRFPLEALCKACPSVAGVSVNLNPSEGAQVIKGPIRPVWGEREVWVEVQGVRLRVSPGAFFQVNLSLLPHVHRLMREFLGEGEALVDLYSGVGTHAVALRGGFRRVVCVEGVRGAVADAKATFRANALAGMSVISAPVEKSVKRWNDARAEALVLNPSRQGAREEVLRGIATSRAARVAYLSCDPGTLCRDLAQLVSLGFELVSVQPIDMMPQTLHVEALALLRRTPV